MVMSAAPAPEGAISGFMETMPDWMLSAFRRWLEGQDDNAVLSPGGGAFAAADWLDNVMAFRGDDVVTLSDGADRVFLGRGDDTLTVSGPLGFANGGQGRDSIAFLRETGSFDIVAQGNRAVLTDRFTGAETELRSFETISFLDRSYSMAELRRDFGPQADAPAILVADGTQRLTVNDPDPTPSVVWDRVAQQAIIEADYPTGPTVASRVYGLVHTAIYDAWASYDADAVRVSFDVDGDNVRLTGTDAEIEVAMNFAAYTVLAELFPEQTDLLRAVMVERYDTTRATIDTVAARVGVDAARDLLALREGDGSRDASDYAPANPSPLVRNDITRWTPENVPTDPEDGMPEQRFLTPQWGGVEGFALPRGADGETDYAGVLPPPPQPLFTDAYADSVLNFDDRTVTLSAALTLDGVDHAAGETVAVSKALIGSVINAGFVAQAEEVVHYSAELDDRGKVIAEFWEDGRGTAFPPGTFMSFGHFVSARDGNDMHEDAALFLALGNAQMDAAIASWESKVFYDYARPVRLIRDLGELGLIGEPGVDEMTGEEGFVVEAFAGFDPDTGLGMGTRTILAENWISFQRPSGESSPPFAEYTSGHSAFSAAGAEVLKRFTGSDRFGGSTEFGPDTIQFERNVPVDTLVLEWDTFTEAGDQAGLSRLYGGIHFHEGNVNGLALGHAVGAAAFERAMAFVEGTATDADRPFADDFIG